VNELQPAPDAVTLLVAVRGLTHQALAFVQLLDQLHALMPKVNDQITALQTAVLGFGDLVEHLQHRVDRLERQASLLHAVGRVQ